jgi:hypothetical protein
VAIDKTEDKTEVRHKECSIGLIDLHSLPISVTFQIRLHSITDQHWLLTAGHYPEKLRRFRINESPSRLCSIVTSVGSLSPPCSP